MSAASGLPASAPSRPAPLATSSPLPQQARQGFPSVPTMRGPEGSWPFGGLGAQWRQSPCAGGGPPPSQGLLNRTEGTEGFQRGVEYSV